jgi:hypothetical protein
MNPTVSTPQTSRPDKFSAQERAAMDRALKANSVLDFGKGLHREVWAMLGGVKRIL